MNTADRVQLGIAIAGVLGLGALLKAAFDHFLSRKEKRVDLAEKWIRVADAAVGLSEAQLARARTVIETLQRESEELRERLAGGSDENLEKLTKVYDGLESAREEMASLQEQLSRRVHPSALPRGLGRLIPQVPPPSAGDLQSDWDYVTSRVSAASDALDKVQDALNDAEGRVMEVEAREMEEDMARYRASKSHLDPHRLGE